MKALSRIPRGDKKRDFHLLQIQGDCMEPTLHSGDVVIANIQEKNIIDALYLLDFDGEIAVRRLQNCSDGNIRLICDNPLYESYIVDAEKLNILGRCVGVMKRA